MAKLTESELEDLRGYTLKEIFAQIHLQILASVPLPSDIAAEKEELGFDALNGHKKYRAAIDLLEDTQYAIKEVMKRGLHTCDDVEQQHGEQYVRLYGVLNAVSLQMLSIRVLHSLFKDGRTQGSAAAMKELMIYRVRNAAGAHTLDNQTKPGGKNTTFHRITQSDFSKWGDRLTFTVDGEGVVRFDLMAALRQYEDTSDRILHTLTKDVIDRTFPKAAEDKDWLTARLSYIAQKIAQRKYDVANDPVEVRW